MVEKPYVVNHKEKNSKQSKKTIKMQKQNKQPNHATTTEESLQQIFFLSFFHWTVTFLHFSYEMLAASDYPIY